MHFLPIIVFFVVLKTSLLCAFGGPRQLWHFIKDCVTIVEDQWTWRTRSGECFEDAEIEWIEEGALVLKHRHGVARLTIDALSEKSRDLLYHSQKWTDYVATFPAAVEVTAFDESRTPQLV